MINLPIISEIPVADEKTIWRSLDDLADTPELHEFAKKEFPGFANVYEGLGEAEVEEGALSRRQFLALSAAGLGLAGLSGCRRPDLQILPYSQTPDNIVPGVPLFYATSIPRPGTAFPVLVESHEGRPTKIEGNPKHPASLGKSDTHAQAAILELYSPDRSREVMMRDQAGKMRVSSWEAFDREISKIMETVKEGTGLRFLAEDVNSPALRIVREHIATALPNSVWHTYEPLDAASIKAATEMVFGKPLQVSYNFKKAKRILALDADFLGVDDNLVANSQAFSDSRKAPADAETHQEELSSKLSRLYVVESGYSITGTMADHRLKLPSSHVAEYVVALAKHIGELKSDSTLKSIGGMVSPTVSIPQPWIEAVAADLLDPHFKGKALVLAGARQPALVHAICFSINQVLGAIGESIEFRDLPVQKSESIASLAKAIEEGKVSTLFILGGNPAYNAPADLDFAAAMEKVTNRIRLGLFRDDTSDTSTWDLPAAHFLESWGDAETADGTYSIVQPLIAPLHGGRSILELLIQISGYDDAKNASDARGKVYELLRKSFAKRTGKMDDDPALDAAFKAIIQKGFVEDSARKPEKPAFNAAKSLEALKRYTPPSSIGENQFELCFYPDYSVQDGRFATNSWLMEWPDPITKLVWDNAAIISPKSADKLGVKQGDIIEIEAGGGKIKIPVYILPGQTDFSIALPLGYGKLRISRVPEGGGFNVYPVRTSTDPYFARADKVAKTSEKYQLVTTQEHGVIPEPKEEDILHEYSLGKYEQIIHGELNHQHKDDPKSRFQYGYKNRLYKVNNNEGLDSEQRQIKEIARKEGEDVSYPARLDGVMQWGMVIDLNSCTGCSACVVACQAENNIPVVGKNEVRLNREMHWIRLDRYFTTKMETSAEEHAAAEFKEDPHIVTQPMMCQQCEAAPCESVCPVNAAVHSPEGLNLQVYNRCIGTRYCSNNCPYKVRRFNWFDFNKRRLDELRVPTPFSDAGVPETLKMQKNPDVTVRMRGVMEKCTYCIQRIERAKIGSEVLAAKAGMDTVDAPPTTSHEQEYKLGFAIRQYGDQSKVIVPDGIIAPACAQACPSKAIVFGNVNDPQSKVYQMKNSRVADYLVLGMLNAKPRTSYLPRLRNLNEKMKEAGA
jgi:molybdopterin-containing oxidoreductase family iron-sulfur binding subunit